MAKVLTNRRACATLIAVLSLALVILDLETSPDISFLGFYFLPVLLAAWYLGRREALGVALASVAVWVLDDLLAQHRYSHIAIPIWNRSVELGFFVLVAWIAGTLRVVLQRELAARAERLEHDLQIAREVQAALLPQPRLETGKFVAAAVCQQALGVGGDAYDLVQTEQKALAIALADVSGKGMPAALLMATFLATFRALLPLHADRMDVLSAELSRRLRESMGPFRFVTAFLAVAENGSLRYVNAGHVPGILLSPTAGVTMLDPTGPILGPILLKDVPFREETVPFPAGSVLLLCTDGVTERANKAGEELGAERVARIATAVSSQAPAAIVGSVLAAAEAHAGGEPASDDMTLLCVLSRPAGFASAA